MKVLGFNFTKINIEKLSEITKDLKIGTSIDVPDIKEIDSDMFKTKEKFLAVKFSHTINYEPDLAKLEFSGNVLISLDYEKVEEVIDMWKDKKMPEDFRLSLFNLIMRKCSIKALELEENVNLPYHIPMPSLKVPEKEKDKKDKKSK